jgi:hypothetical protein
MYTKDCQQWCIAVCGGNGFLWGHSLFWKFHGCVRMFVANTYPERGEAPIGFVPVLAGGETFRTLSNTFVSFNFLFSSHNNKHYCSISPCLTTLLRRQRLVDYHIITDNDEVVLTPLYKGNIYQAPSADATASLAMAAPPFF